MFAFWCENLLWAWTFIGVSFFVLHPLKYRLYYGCIPHPKCLSLVPINLRLNVACKWLVLPVRLPEMGSFDWVLLWFPRRLETNAAVAPHDCFRPSPFCSTVPHDPSILPCNLCAEKRQIRRRSKVNVLWLYDVKVRIRRQRQEDERKEDCGFSVYMAVRPKCFYEAYGEYN